MGVFLNSRSFKFLTNFCLICIIIIYIYFDSRNVTEMNSRIALSTEKGPGYTSVKEYMNYYLAENLMKNYG